MKKIYFLVILTCFTTQIWAGGTTEVSEPTVTADSTNRLYLPQEI